MQFCPLVANSGTVDMVFFLFPSPPRPRPTPHPVVFLFSPFSFLSCYYVVKEQNSRSANVLSHNVKNDTQSHSFYWVFIILFRSTMFFVVPTRFFQAHPVLPYPILISSILFSLCVTWNFTHIKQISLALIHMWEGSISEDSLSHHYLNIQVKGSFALVNLHLLRMHADYGKSIVKIVCTSTSGLALINFYTSLKEKASLWLPKPSLFGF